VREPLRSFDLVKTKIQKCVVEEGDESTRRPLSLRDLFVPGIVIAAINLSSTYLLQAFYLETEVLYLSTPIRDGGLGFSPRAIGTLSSISATVTGMSQLFIFPHVHEKWGSKKVFVLGLFAFIPLFVLWPLMNWIAKKDGYSGLVWFGLAAQICCSAVNGFAWRKSCLTLTLKKSHHKCVNHMYSCNFGFYHPIVRKPCFSSRLLSGVFSWFLSVKIL
jgi:hypothetical protein